jgi:hypothetical protein
MEEWKMSIQMSLDFSRPPVVMQDDGKKLEKITFTGSADLKQYLTSIAEKQRVSVSELCQRYIVSGLTKDLGDMLLLQLNGDKTLSSLLNRQ